MRNEMKERIKGITCSQGTDGINIEVPVKMYNQQIIFKQINSLKANTTNFNLNLKVHFALAIV